MVEAKRMHRELVAVMTALVMVAGTAGASVLQDASGGAINYQNDEDAHTDAADSCSEILDAHDKTPTNVTREIRGLLVPVDDEADFYGVNVTQELLGHRIRVEVASNVIDVGLTAFQPECLATVFEEPEESYDPDADRPSAPAPEEGNKTIDAAVEDYDCNPDEWKFMLKRQSGEVAPSEIYVDWGEPQGPHAVPLSKASSGTVAMYVTTLNLEFTVQGASAEVSEDWDEPFFMISHGPCETTEWAPQPPTAGPNSIEFTAVRQGTYGIGILSDLDADVPMVVIPASCHTVCVPGLDEARDEGGYVSEILDKDQDDDPTF